MIEWNIKIVSGWGHNQTVSKNVAVECCFIAEITVNYAETAAT